MHPFKNVCLLSFKISNHHKNMCGCEIFISESTKQYELNLWRSRNLETNRIVSQIFISRRSDQDRKKNIIALMKYKKWF